ncbi:MAG: ABC transporter ATP-binding protein [Thermoprotei archaeon]
MSELLCIEGIDKSFGGRVVLGIERFVLSENTYNVVVGPSGSGKTTMLRIIAGLEQADKGRLTLAGEDITSRPPWTRDIGLVFQNYALYPHLSVYENIAMPLTVKKIPPVEVKNKVKQLAEVMKIADYLDKYPRQMSGGQQQRVALARAVVKEPKLLLLDEPLSNLDAKVRVELRTYLKEFQRKLKIAVLHVTHDQGEAMALADNLAVMGDGVIQAVGSPRDIYENPPNLFTASFIGTLNQLDGDKGKWPWSGVGSSKVGVRPENIVIHKEGKTGLVEGKISTVEFMGDSVMLYVDVAGQSVKVKSDATVSYEEGQTVYLEFKKWLTF